MDVSVKTTHNVLPGVVTTTGVVVSPGVVYSAGVVVSAGVVTSPVVLSPSPGVVGGAFQHRKVQHQINGKPNKMGKNVQTFVTQTLLSGR